MIFHQTCIVQKMFRCRTAGVDKTEMSVFCLHTEGLWLLFTSVGGELYVGDSERGCECGLWLLLWNWISDIRRRRLCRQYWMRWCNFMDVFSHTCCATASSCPMTRTTVTEYVFCASVCITAVHQRCFPALCYTQLNILCLCCNCVGSGSRRMYKKSELMLLRHARVYSISCSQVILVYLHPFRRNSFLQPKITKKSPKPLFLEFKVNQDHQCWQS